MKLAGKVAIVTGAGGGIGRAIADAFLTEGAYVVLCDIRTEPLAPLKDGQVYRRLDVSSEEQWASVVGDVVREKNTVNVLVNNAAIISYQKVHEVTLDEWNKSIAVNLTGVMLGMREVIPHMRAAGGGSIINLASAWALKATDGPAAYHATKAGVRMLSRNAAICYAPDKIRVNAMVPGLVLTPMIAAQAPETAARTASQIPLGTSTPEEVAAGAVFLASDDSSAMTAADFVIDGGYTAC